MLVFQPLFSAGARAMASADTDLASVWSDQEMQKMCISGVVEIVHCFIFRIGESSQDNYPTCCRMGHKSGIVSLAFVCLRSESVNVQLFRYGYVGASRGRFKSGIYLYGMIRRTDWLPVRSDSCVDGSEQLHRGVDSESDGSEDRAASQCTSLVLHDVGIIFAHLPLQSQGVVSTTSSLKKQCLMFPR